MHAMKTVLRNCITFNAIIILNNLHKLNIYDNLTKLEKQQNQKSEYSF